MGLPAANPEHHAVGIAVSAVNLPHKRYSVLAEHGFDVFLALVLFLELVLVLGKTAIRGMFNTSLVWANEVAE